MPGDPLTFETAGGLVTTGLGASVWINEPEAEVQPHVLHTPTPAVPSVRARCMKLGYYFIWLPGQNPYFVKPDRLIGRLEVYHNIPYLRPGRRCCQPREPSSEAAVPGVITA